MAWPQSTRVGLVAGALSLAVYLATLCPTVYVEGSGELIGATYLLGTPHPTGYPLYCLLGRLCSLLLPLGTPAHQINLFTALTAAAAVGLLAALLSARGLSAAAAGSAGLAFAFSSTFWSQAVIAEVYGLAMVGAVLLLWLGLRSAASGKRGPWLLLAYMAGLGLTLHLSLILLWPALALLHWQRQRHLLFSGSLLALAVASAALGFSPALYLLVRNGLGNAFHWGTIASVGQWWAHLNGELYRDSFFSLPPAAMWQNLQRWGAQMAREFHPFLLPLLAWGAWEGYRRDRWLWVLLAGGVVANLVVALNYHRDPNGIGVFFLVSILAAAVLLGWAIQAATELRFWRGRQQIAGWGLGTTLVAGVLAFQYPRADHSGIDVAQRYGTDILAGLPPGAIVFTEGDDAAFILDYLQRVEGLRPDVRLYNRMGRGRDLLNRAELAADPNTQGRLRAQREGQLIRQEQAPLYYLYPRRLAVDGFRLFPEGLLYRVWPLSASPTGLPVPQVPVVPGTELDPWVRKIQANYAFMEGEGLLARGDTTAALAAYRRAAATAPDSRSTRFNVALILLRANHLEEAAHEAEAAARLDPWNPEVHRLAAQIRVRSGSGGNSEELHKITGEIPDPP